MRVPLTIVRARREELARLLQQYRYLPIAELCQRLKISEATARRDLAALEKARKITRTYGGALLDFNSQFASFHERLLVGAEAKKKIARAARRLIEPGMTIFLDAGTTVHALAMELMEDPVLSLKVVTNNLPVAEALSRISDMETHLLGGQLLNRQSVLLGDRARAALKHWQFDQVFLSAEGMTAEGMWNSQADVVAFQQAVLERARTAYYCLARQKIGHQAPCLLQPLEQVRHLITDGSAADLKKAGITLADCAVVRV